jgi:hypothetical protein
MISKNRRHGRTAKSRGVFAAVNTPRGEVTNGTWGKNVRKKGVRHNSFNPLLYYPDLVSGTFSPPRPMKMEIYREHDK